MRGHPVRIVPVETKFLRDPVFRQIEIHQLQKQNSLEAEKQDKALVRFINSHPDIKAVDTFVGNTPEFKDVAYKTRDALQSRAGLS